MMDQNNLKDKLIIVVGGTVGIGKTTAIYLSEQGAKVVLVSSNEDRLKEVVSSLKGEGHGYAVLDLNHVDLIEKEIKQIITSYGAVDGLVYCVGARSRRPLKMLKPAMVSEVLNINFTAFVEMVRNVSKKNAFNKGLSIVGISSIASSRGSAGVTAYAASKAAMESAVRCIAKELAPKEIRINTVVPAQINTPAYQHYMEMSGNAEDPTLVRQYLGLGETQDVANVIGFLLSNQSRFITGSSIPVEGGYLSS